MSLISLLPTLLLAGTVTAQQSSTPVEAGQGVEPLQALDAIIPIVLHSPPSIPVTGNSSPPSIPRGLGLSGSIKVVIAPGLTALSRDWLAPFGSGWEQGHRWTRVGGEYLPGLPGEPVEAPKPFEVGDVRTPGSPAAWLLESATGSTLSVVTPYATSLRGDGILNGYHLGVYPVAAIDSSDVYAPPESFIEVTPGNQNLLVSRHLTLRQFLTKDQFDVWPKYVALDLRLVDKLELVIQELNAMGVRADRIHVMSGFRSPQYNGPGGDGRAALSRHMWGDAADVWIDNDGDNQMDDLNGDGVIDMYDAMVVMRAVERVEGKFPQLIGGAGTYPVSSTHGPYIHIDARGYHARW